VTSALGPVAPLLGALRRDCNARRALATEKLLVLATFFLSVQNGLHRDSMCVCVLLWTAQRQRVCVLSAQNGLHRDSMCVYVLLLLRIRTDRRKKRRWVQPVVSERLLTGPFYELYEDLSNCRGELFSCCRTSTESFDNFG
jgi:hypothetical protein